MSSNGLCLLSLDGGGVRGLSTLYILRQIMVALNHTREKAGLPAVKPCDVFDLIGGTSTGGLIAIMLGRLGMGVDDCIKAYTELIETIFKKKERRTGLTLRPRFSSERLQEGIESVLNQQGIPLQEAFNDGQTGISRACKVFVCCCDRANSRRIIRLKSYDVDGKVSPLNPPSIVQAALATSAAPSIFDAVDIDDVVHLDGALGASNPVKQVASEASDIWFDNEGDPALQANIKCFLSIGTGHPGITRVKTENALRFLTDTLVKMATDTENIADEFAHSWRDPLSKGKYFRFNVQQGLQDVGLEEYIKKGDIQSATAAYLDERKNKNDVKDCVEAMKDKQNMDSLELQLYHPLRFERISKRWAVMSSPKLCENIFERISDYDPKHYIELITGQKCPQTTDWILSDHNYCQWKEDNSAYFWLTGKIGSGKTFITTTVIEDLVRIGFVGYYFYQPTESARLQACDLFRSYILQIIAYLDYRKIRYPDSIVFSITGTFGPRASFPALHVITKSILIPLHEVLSRHGHEAFYVLDGLDACSQEEISRILRTFRNLSHIANCHIFISARDEIRNRTQITGNHAIQLSEYHIQNDIRHFIEWKMEEKRQLEGPLTTNQRLLVKISQVLNEKAHLMILWVSLQIDAIWDCAGAADDEIRKVLDNLPKDLNETYYRCISKVRKPLGPRAISYVYAALTPFHIEQLREVLAINEETGRLEKGKIPEFRAIMTSCAGLISHSHTNNFIVPAHHSAVLFLERVGARKNLPEDRIDVLKVSRLALGGLCVRHLTGPDYTLQVSSSNPPVVALPFGPKKIIESLHLPTIPGLFRSKVTQPIQFKVPMILNTQDSGLSPAFHYARKNWGVLTRDIDPNSAHWHNFKELALGQGKSWNLHPWKPLGQSLNSHYQGLIGWAIAESHLPMLHVLLVTRDVMLRKEIFRLPLPQYDEKLPLELAVCTKSTKIYELILPHCDQKNNKRLKRSLLDHAARVGFIEVLKEFVLDGVNPTLDDSTIVSALNIAAEYGQHEFVNKLFDCSRGLNYQYKCQALKLASRNGHSVTINILLSEWFLPPEKSTVEFPYVLKEAVYEAVKYGQRDAAHTLCQIAIESRNLAVNRSYYSIVKRLLEGILESTVLIEEGISTKAAAAQLLHDSVSQRDLLMVKTLLECGADPGIPYEGKFALEFAVWGSPAKMPIIQLLLEYGAKKRTFCEMEVLYGDSDDGATDVLQLHTARALVPVAEVKYDRGRMPLTAVTARYDGYSINPLLQKGIRVDVANIENGWTALMAVCTSPLSSHPDRIRAIFCKKTVEAVEMLCQDEAHSEFWDYGAMVALMSAIRTVEATSIEIYFEGNTLTFVFSGQAINHMIPWLFERPLKILDFHIKCHKPSKVTRTTFLHDLHWNLGLFSSLHYYLSRDIVVEVTRIDVQYAGTMEDTA